MTRSDFVPASRPPLPDLKSCDAWLASASVADSRQACTAYLTLLDELEIAPPRHASYLAIMERLRVPMLGAIAEQSRKFAAKSLPLAHSEAWAFKQVSDLWLAQFRAYRLLLRAALKGSHPDLAPHIAVLAARAIGCSAELVATQIVARQRVDPATWQRLHTMYALAEGHGVAQTPIGNPARRETCDSLFVQPLLLSLASPHGLAMRELQWLRRWIPRWAHKVGIGRPPAKPFAFAVDVAGDSEPAWLPTESASTSLRFLDTGAIGRALRKRSHSLAEGQEPAALGLGRDCVQPAAGELLGALHRRWCAGPAARRFTRRATAQPGPVIEVAIGLPAAHFSVSGKPFSDGTNMWDYTRKEADEIHIFRHDPDARARRARESEEPPLEHWDAINESADGFQLQRAGPGGRVAHRQMLSLRPPGAPQFILAEVRWLMQQADQTLIVGACALPGLARACAVRPISADPARPDPYAQGFVLTISSGLPVTLALPPGWYQRDRLLDLRLDEGTVRIRLGSLLGRGFDYERADFTAAS